MTRPLCLGLGLLLLTLGAASAQPVPIPHKQPPPRGEIADVSSAGVYCYRARWHGDPAARAPMSVVSGRFELVIFPSPGAERSTSVFFARPGFLARHREVRAGEPPELGSVRLKELPQGQGGVAGIVPLVDRSSPERGIVRYLQTEVTLTSLTDGAQISAVSSRSGAFARSLPPGRYKVSAKRGGKSTTVTIRAGHCELVVLEVEVAPLPDSPPEREPRPLPPGPRPDPAPPQPSPAPSPGGLPQPDPVNSGAPPRWR